MVVCRWPKYQVHTCIFFAWKLADGPNIRYAHILHIADGKWPNTRYRHVLHMADGPNTTYTHFSHKLADGPNTRYMPAHVHIFHMADGSNTRHTDVCIVFI